MMENRQPTISIVVPSYQQGPYIKHCVESILAQNEVQVEVFVFDSKSSDETREVLREFGSRVKTVLEEDLGQGHAVNKGLKQCKGDIIGFLNSDDVLLPGALNAVVDFWRENPSTDLLYGKATYIDEKGDVIADYRTKDWDWERFQGECFICQPAAFWSRRIMNNIGFLDQRLNCSIDYDYWLRIVQASGVVGQIDEYLACSRDYPETKTRSLRGSIFIENFQISLRRLGYVHRSWISQVMDFFKYERKTFFGPAIPAHGKFRDFLTRIAQSVSSVFARDVYVTEKPYEQII
ncbi:MAG: glycosyltransferase family 2 protein [Opitutaceae bacterium]|nr:glycosyltransferase family 2 protein [Opitutaceae bacterium]